MINTTDIITPEQAKSLSGLFQERVKRSATRIAYRGYDSDKNTWTKSTWAEMAHEVERWQSAFADEPLEPGDRVAVMINNCREWVIFEQAALAMGLVVVPLYVNDRAENVAYILDDADIKVLLLPDSEQWQGLQEIRSTLDKLVRILTLQNISDNVSANLRNLDSWLPQNPKSVDKVSCNPNDLATIVYTSGTTGRPKGVMLSHHNILWNAFSSMNFIPCYLDDVFLSFLPLSHTLERTAGYYLPMMGGAEVAYARSIPLLAEDLLSIRPTVLISVPRIYERIVIKVRDTLAEKGGIAPKLFEAAVKIGWQHFQYQQGRTSWSSSLIVWPILQKLVAKKILDRLGGRIRAAMCGGAPLSLPVAQVFLGLGLPLIQGYGLTETSPVISVNSLEDNDPASVGKPLQDVNVKIAEDGELLANGPGIMLGYWNHEKATKDVIDADGWLHTGDKAEIKEGRIYITGRLKEIIVLANGEKVPPSDMETAIVMDSLFEQVLIIGEGRPFLSALVVLDADHWHRIRKEQGLEGDDAVLLQERWAKQVALERIAYRIRSFPGYAQVRAVNLTLDPWTVENGLITPTLKLRRDQIIARLDKEITALYHGH